MEREVKQMLKLKNKKARLQQLGLLSDNTGTIIKNIKKEVMLCIIMINLIA